MNGLSFSFYLAFFFFFFPFFYSKRIQKSKKKKQSIIHLAPTNLAPHDLQSSASQFPHLLHGLNGILRTQAYALSEEPMSSRWPIDLHQVVVAPGESVESPPRAKQRQHGKKKTEQCHCHGNFHLAWVISPCKKRSCVKLYVTKVLQKLPASSEVFGLRVHDRSTSGLVDDFSFVDQAPSFVFFSSSFFFTDFSFRSCTINLLS